jgi:hypothetical protein
MRFNFRLSALGRQASIVLINYDWKLAVLQKVFYKSSFGLGKLCIMHELLFLTCLTIEEGVNLAKKFIRIKKKKKYFVKGTLTRKMLVKMR